MFLAGEPGLEAWAERTYGPETLAAIRAIAAEAAARLVQPPEVVILKTRRARVQIVVARHLRQAARGGTPLAETLGRWSREPAMGTPIFFATATPLGGYAQGVLVESHTGRPTKVEGNPDHPASRGGTDPFAQASILGLYDPDRSQALTYMGGIRTWADFLGAIQGVVETQNAAPGGRDQDDELDSLHERFKKPILLSEFGADEIPGQHAQPSEMFSEEYQAEMLVRHMEMLRQKPFVIGEHIWNLCDFKTSQGITRMGGMNYKGIFTRDRRPKLAAHRVRDVWKG